MSCRTSTWAIFLVQMAVGSVSLRRAMVLMGGRTVAWFGRLATHHRLIEDGPSLGAG